MLDKNAFGKRLMIARNDLKLTQDQLGEQCGISSEHLRKIEAGERSPSIDLLVALCVSLRVSASYLLQDCTQTEYHDSVDTLNDALLTLSPKEKEALISMIPIIRKLHD